MSRSSTPPATLARRLPRDERRRQLLGIGLRKLVERPIQDVSIDEVAAEAGISRGLLFHYFPTKNAFHQEVVAAAGRRVLRNVAPDEDGGPAERLAQFVERFVLQVDRRRDSYLALVYGRAAATLDSEGIAGTLRQAMATLVVEIAGLDAAALPVVHGWVAYVEDRALIWSEPPTGDRDLTLEDLVAQCTAALDALLAVRAPRQRPSRRASVT